MKIKVLITAVGGAVGQGILKAVKMSSLKCEIVTADAQPYAAGLYRGHVGYIIPLASDDDFIDEIIRICSRENVDAILIGTDYELLKFAESKKRIEKETNAKVIVSSHEKIKIANDKWLTQKFLVENNLPNIPSTLPDDIENLPNFPLIIKPRIGDSSKDTFIVQNKADLKEKLKLFKNKKTTNVYQPNAEPMVQEYLPNAKQEYTSTTITFDNHCFGVLSMNREMHFGGHTTKAIIDDFPGINKEIKKVAEVFNAFGPANFQSRVYNGEPKIFEINCRFSGTTPFCAMAGFNTVDGALRHVILDEPVQKPRYKKGVILRYFNEVFVDEEEHLKLRKNNFIKEPKSKVNEAF